MDRSDHHTRSLIGADDEPAPDRLIEVVLPARTEMAATLRVLCASIGADLGFSVDEIDDLKLAVNEVFSSAADTDDPGRVSVSFEPAHGRVRVMMFAIGPTPIELDVLASTILGSIVEDLSTDAGAISFTKRNRESVGPT